MAVKRRTVWLSDEAWDAAERQATRFEMTRSAYLSSLIIGGRVTPVSFEEFMDKDRQYRQTPTETRPLTQAERDTILRKVNKG